MADDDLNETRWTDLPEKRLSNLKIEITKRRVRLWEIINLVNLSEIKSTSDLYLINVRFLDRVFLYK